MKVRLDHFDREIIRFLDDNEESNTNEISGELKISWATTNVHLKRLQRLGYASSRIENGTRIWRLNYDD